MYILKLVKSNFEYTYGHHRAQSALHYQILARSYGWYSMIFIQKEAKPFIICPLDKCYGIHPLDGNIQITAAAEIFHLMSKSYH